MATAAASTGFPAPGNRRRHQVLVVQDRGHELVGDDRVQDVVHHAVMGMSRRASLMPEPRQQLVHEPLSTNRRHAGSQGLGWSLWSDKLVHGYPIEEEVEAIVDPFDGFPGWTVEPSSWPTS